MTTRRTLMRSILLSVFAGALAIAELANARNADAARRCRVSGVSDSCVTRHARHMRTAPLADSYNSFYSDYGPSGTYNGYNDWGTYSGYDGSETYSGFGASGTPRWPPSGGAP